MIDAELVTRKMVLIAQDLTALQPIARKALADEWRGAEGLSPSIVARADRVLR